MASCRPSSSSSPSDSTPFRVLIADDHAIVRDGLSLIIDSIDDVDLVGEATDGKEAISQFLALNPDLMVLDLRMPEADGLDVVRTLVAEIPEARILIVTTYDTDEDIYHAIEAGAKGYLLKESPRDIIREAVLEILSGGNYTPAKITNKLIRRLGSSPLTPREMDVLRLVAVGRINKEIATDLGIGDGTVKTHMANLLKKLDAHSRTEAVATARERGYLT